MPHSRHRPRVLFVDDEEHVTRDIRRSLHGQPYEVLTANSPAEALRLLQKKHVDVIVSDDRMPEQSGAELLTRVRHEHPGTVRLMLTGEASVETAAAAVNEAGVYRFLIKPCSPEELARCVQHALEEHADRREYDRWKESASGLDTAELTAQFDRALEGIWMAFQPIVRAGDGTTAAYEALARTRSTTIPNPGALFEAAEALDRVLEVERLIRERIAERLPFAPAGTRVFVNLHPRSLLSDELFDDENPLHRFADRVVLEITERSSLGDIDQIKDRINALRARGYGIALDDLGSGYAGLTSFALLIPDIVKFDIDLTRGIEESEAKRKLIAAMCSLCHELEMVTVAEGVETEGERNAAVELGCDLIQGFYYARPEAEFRRAPEPNRDAA